MNGMIVASDRSITTKMDNIVVFPSVNYQVTICVRSAAALALDSFVFLPSPLNSLPSFYYAGEYNNHHVVDLDVKKSRRGLLKSSFGTSLRKVFIVELR